MKSKLTALFAICLLVTVSAQVVLAQIHAGTKLTGAINESLNSKDAQVGQTFTLSNAHTSNYDVTGATLYGHVSHVQRAGMGTPGKIELAVDKVNTKSGSIYKISGQVVNMQVNTKSNAGKEALATAGGALLGGLLGNGTWALVGAAGGFLVAKNSRENVTIPQGSLVTVEVSSSTKIK
jgi:hypothetical protein